MKRSEVLARLPFQVPDIKKKRVIVHSDIAANFEWRYRTIAPQLEAQLQKARESGMLAEQLAQMQQSMSAFTSQWLTTMEQSYREGQKLHLCYGKE